MTGMDEDRLWGGPAPGRDCDDCSACCRIFAIESDGLSKPADVLCHHRSAGGCEIYAQRPQVCRTFFCAWRRIASMPEETRPDRMGVVFSLARPAVAVNILRKVYIRGMAINSWEDFRSPHVDRTVAMFRSGGLPVWLQFGETAHLVHPSEAVANVLIRGEAPSTPEVAIEAERWRQRYQA